jgi:DNA polymerase V
VVTDHISLHVGYEKEREEGAFQQLEGLFSQSSPSHQSLEPSYSGKAARQKLEPTSQGVKAAHSRSFGYAGGSRKLPQATNSFKPLFEAFESLFLETVDPQRLVRRINLGFGNLIDEDFATYSLFTDVDALEEERRRQETILAIKEKFGKNALFKGTSLKEAALGRERNTLIGGHRA